MSSEQEENEQENEEEGDEDEQQEEGDEDEDEDEDSEQGEDGSEQEEGSGQDEDQQSGEEGSDQQDKSGSESKQEQQQKRDFVPKFRSIQPEEFKLTNLLSEISSLSMNVDHFITTLPSHGGSTYRSYLPAPSKYVPPPAPPVMLPEEPRVVVMKDEDVQVSMQPQIVIQPTKVEKAPVEQAFKISSQSNKFLAQLYEENKKLKRWQNTSHNMNSNNGGSSAGNGFYGSRERFERQDYEKGLFNVEERNREIDEAIERLRLEDGER